MATHPARLASTLSTTIARALLGLQLMILTIGVLQFAFMPNSVERPLLAVIALVLLTVSLFLVRMLPVLRSAMPRQHMADVATMIVAITMLAVATGAARSAVVPLYLAPLAGSAVASGRWWVAFLVAIAIAALGFLLGALTPQIDIASQEFCVLLVSALAPGTVVALLLANLVERMQIATRRISDLAATDTLTGLMNLRAFEGVLQQEHRKAERFGRPYSLVMVDIDDVSQVNETLGHEAGNQIIAAVATAILRAIRSSDVAARLGGNEFIVLLMEADTETATVIGQRIRNHVYAGTVSVANRMIRANVSVGVANFPGDHLYAKDLMRMAGQRTQQDRQQRREKNAGT